MRVWLVGKTATVRVVVNAQWIVVEAAPLVSRFRGQSFERLRLWFDAKFGLRSVEEYPE